jgi:hypothetical protein
MLILLTKKSFSSILSCSLHLIFLTIDFFFTLFYRFFGLFCAWPDDDYKYILQMYGYRIDS